MPKSRVADRRMFREFSVMREKYLNKNHLKNLKHVTEKYAGLGKEINIPQLQFMLWVYDLEFFTLKYAHEGFSMSENTIGPRIVFPLMRLDYIYKQFDRKNAAGKSNAAAKQESPSKYRHRYALTQKGRLLVQRFYTDLEKRNH